MGRKFEQPVAPIVRSMLGDIELGSVLLYRKSQARLAAWAYKTTLMIETAREGGPQISDSAYRRFRSSGQPPGHCSIVLSRAGHGGLTYHRHATRGQHLNLEGIEQFYSAILVVKELFFHVLGDLPPGIAAKAHGSLFDSIPAWGKNTLWLWPSDGSRLSWPPHGYMSKDAIEHIANAFGGTFEFMEETAADHDSPAGG